MLFPQAYVLCLYVSGSSESVITVFPPADTAVTFSRVVSLVGADTLFTVALSDTTLPQTYT